MRIIILSIIMTFSVMADSNMKTVKLNDQDSKFLFQVLRADPNVKSNKLICKNSRQLLVLNTEFITFEGEYPVVGPYNVEEWTSRYIDHDYIKVSKESKNKVGDVTLQVISNLISKIATRNNENWRDEHRGKIFGEIAAECLKNVKLVKDTAEGSINLSTTCSVSYHKKK